MKFNVKLALGAVVAALLALAAAPWTVSQDAQIRAIEGKIRSASGLRLVTHGRSVFAILPRPHIRIHDARLEDDGGSTQITLSSLRFDLSVMGLLTGRLDPARAQLDDAVVVFDAARPQTAESRARIAQGGMAFGEVDIVNGKVFWRSASGVKRLVADEVEARLDWGQASKPLSLTGHCLAPMLEGEAPRAHFALWAAQPDKLARGEESAITLRIDSDAFQADLNGGLALDPRPRFHGRFASAASSLRAAANWFGVPLPLPGRYADASVKGEATLDPALFAFPKLSATVDGNALEGAASIRLDGARPLISATLAGDAINLAPMLEDVPPPTVAGQWSHDIFPPSRLGATDLDLRLSARHVRLSDYQIDAAAVSAILKAGRLDLSLAEASAYSGQARARVVVAEAPGGLDIRGSVAAQKIDVAALLWDGFKRQSLSGAARINVSFETGGASFYELASRLDARGDVGIDAGEVYGVDLGLAFRHMEQRPLSVGQDLRSGRTAFDQLVAKFDIVQGQAEIEEGAARNDQFAAYFSGHAQIAERNVELHATASRAPASADAKPMQLGFTLTGGWDDATLVPDALGLINRSDAAAPLLPKAAPPN